MPNLSRVTSAFCGLLIFGLLFSHSFFLQAQLKQRLNLPIQTTPHYQASQSNTCLLPMPFAQSIWVSNADKDSLNLFIVERIDLVFTNYKESGSFSQELLNEQRFKAFQRAFPALWNNPMIEWRLIGQSEAANAAEAKELFHGFAITYRPPPSLESSKKELDFLTRVKDELLGLDETKIPNLSVVGSQPVYYDTVITGVKQRWDDKIGFVHDTTYEVRAMAYKPKVSRASKVPRDSVLFLALSTQAMNWPKAALICDVTGSMSPYSSQLLDWVRLFGRASDINYFLFFNDGNQKASSKKRIGQTGGLYGTHQTGLTPIFETMHKAMSRGTGGDGPENDVEALLQAAKEYPECEHLLLIADNDAPVRDLVLSKELKHPVHVFVCGTKRGVNPQYLELARNTGGSLHTETESFSELHLLREGATLKVENMEYVLQENHFIRQY